MTNAFDKFVLRQDKFIKKLNKTVNKNHYKNAKIFVIKII
jgi:hypothetical protein